ncbi:MAG: transcription antitermination protein NusB [Erysipelotrichaceae bacterium]|nr:transcription antitermination protein NusB [Erysipelotrichaceae bacterium]
MNRHQYRVGIVFALYKHLLLNKDLKECFSDDFNEDDDEFLNGICNDLMVNIDTYITEIAGHLKRWSFERLNYVDQAILLEAVSEISLGLNNKNIVIDEAIRIAKEYCDEDSYRYINGVLDNL